MSKLNGANLYTTYYLNQAGSGYGGIYAGPVYQRGYGIGSFLGGLFRAVMPLIKKGSVILGKECFQTGIDVINDIEKNEEVIGTLKRRGKELYKNVKKRAIETMNGGSYNTTKTIKHAHSPITPRTARIQLRKVKEKNRKKSAVKVLRKSNKKKGIQKVQSKKLREIDIFE